MVNKRIALLFLLPLISACDPLGSPIQFERVNTPHLLFAGAKQQCIGIVDGKASAELCNSRTSQHVLVSPTTTHKVYKINTLDEKCLEVEEKGDAVRFSDCTDEERQNLTFRESKLDSRFVMIVFDHNHRCLELSPEGTLRHAECKSISSQNFLFGKLRAQKQELPKRIWGFWDKGKEAMPGFYKANVKHWEDLLNRKGGQKWEIRILNLIKDDPDYIGNFVAADTLPSPEFLASKIGTRNFEKALNPHIIFSDFLRLELLYEYGGFWMDPSIILHRDLDSVYSVLEELDGFSLAGYTSRHQAEKQMRYADSLENFFIAALPRSNVVDQWRKDFRKYWDLKKPGMAIQDHPMFNGSEGSIIDLANFGAFADYLNQHTALKYSIEKNPKLLDEIFVLGGTGPSEKGPFSLLHLSWNNDQYLIDLNKNGRREVVEKLQGVTMSKFPSASSRKLRLKDEQYFFDTDNIFGIFNSQL